MFIVKFVVFIFIVVSFFHKHNAKPTPKPCKKTPSEDVCKRPVCFDDDFDEDDEEFEPAIKRYKPSIAKEKLKNPFTYKSCAKATNIVLLEKLASLDFSKEETYGYHKEEAETMFSDAKCPTQSFSNDKTILNSPLEASNENFFSYDAKKFRLYRTMIAPYAQYEPSNDMPVRFYKRNANIQSFKSYFIFSVTEAVEVIVNKLKKVKWNENFKGVISTTDYQMLKSNLIYIGSGAPSRPFEHHVETSYLLSGQHLSFAQPVHTYLAKSVRQKLFSKILIVPFFGSNNYPACLYSEQATIWVLKNHTMNTRNYMELKRLSHKLCVERSDPEKYLKNCLSKQAMQFVADFNVETGIRQIGKFGVVLDLTKDDKQNDWSHQIKFKHQPYINSAYRITKKTTLFYKFGSIEYEKFEKFWAGDKQIPLVQDDWVQMLPFKSIDFEFDTNDDWIERIRFANEVENLMKPALSTILPLSVAAQEQFKNFIENLKKEKLDDSFVKLLNNNKKPSSPNIIKLSQLVYQVHINLIMARNFADFAKECQYFASQRIAMFESFFEHLLFLKFFIGNPDVMSTGENQITTSQTTLNLEVPEKFVNLNYKKSSDRPKKPRSSLNELTCPYCGKEFKTAQLFKNHKEAREGARIYSCSVCRTHYTSFRWEHENSLNHRLLSLGQFAPPHPEMENDKLIGQFKCPLHKEGDQRYFELKDNCVEHIKTHATSKEPIDRLEGKDRSTLGIYTCKYDKKFKTDKKEFAEYHIRAVHLSHLIKPADVKSEDYKWQEDLQTHFDIRESADAPIRGNFKCALCPLYFVRTSAVITHLLGPDHMTDFRDAASDKKKNKLIGKEVAKEVVALFEKHNNVDISRKVKEVGDDTEFLGELVKFTGENIRYMFWRIQDENGNYQSDSKCFHLKSTAFSHIFSYDNQKYFTEILANEKYATSLQLKFSNYMKTIKHKKLLSCYANARPPISEEDRKKRQLTSDMKVYSIEKGWITSQKEFRDFIIKEKKIILADAYEIEDDSIEIPDHCNI